MVEARDATQPVYADARYYSAHAHAVRRTDDVLAVVFNRAPRRDFILHPPQDPTFENVIVFSRDGGRTWTAPSVVPGFGWSGVECAGLTATRSGAILLNQWRFRWYPLPLARGKAATEDMALPADLTRSLLQSRELDSGPLLAADPERLAPWGRGGGSAFVNLSTDGGETFARTVEIETAPYRGGYGMRGAAELADGTLVLPLSDVPAYERVFVVRSRDGGANWDAPIPACEEPGRQFEEPAPLVLPSGRIFLAVRENVARTVFTVISDDGGLTWSRPQPTGISGYPAHLLRLDDGRILCTYGYREPPCAIRAVVSRDDGRSWQTEAPLAIREGLPNKDLGYPCSLQLSANALLTIFYAQGTAGTTAIWAEPWPVPAG